MSISSALHSAMSGLTAAGRASQVVSQNIANAGTLGYARRSLLLATNADAGPGVKIVGVQRHADPVVIANRRAADAQAGNAGVLAGFHARMESLVGLATESGLLAAKLTDFETSLITAVSRPDSVQRLDAAVYAAGDLAGAISDAAEGLRQMRTGADRSIGLQVDQLNTALRDVQQLNVRITAMQAGRGDTASLLDQRQVLIDEINEIVPVKTVDRDFGQIALYTDGGAILLDGQPAELGFAVANDTMPHMTVQNGLLSGLTLNGVSLGTSGRNNAIAGGTLAAQFQIRDDLAVEAQAGLDGLARDLIERFETPGLDPTATPGAAALFTDNGAAFDPVDEVGLAGRIAINAVVDRESGGDSWRLRAGLGAAGPGEPGDASLLQSFSDILSEPRALASGGFGPGQLTAFGITSSLTSRLAQDRLQADQVLSFASATRTEMTQIELAQGVDTDAELQSLMLIEQAYAANARVIEVVDEMMQSLLRL